jgi:hypothetical protein
MLSSFFAILGNRFTLADSAFQYHMQAVWHLTCLNDGFAFLEIGDIQVGTQQRLLLLIQQAERDVIDLERVGHFLLLQLETKAGPTHAKHISPHKHNHEKSRTFLRKPEVRWGV